MAQRIVASQAQIAQARFEWEETEIATGDIARRLGWSRTTLYARAKALNFRPRRAAAPADAAIAAQLERTVERELAAIARILAKLPAGDERAAAAERAARTLASLTRTLNEVQRLRREAAEPAPASAEAEPDDMPRDIEEFRRELARRIEAFVAGRADAAVPDDA